MIPLDIYHSNGLACTKIQGPPTLINGMLLKGEVDVGVISLAFYLQHQRDLLRLGRFGILSDGPVLSVMLFSKIDLAEAAEKGVLQVFETPKSATSVFLNRLILRKVYRLHIQAVGTMEEAEAVLLIGNDALVERMKEAWPYQYDLGKEWKKWTGLPMVFAVLATSRETFRRKEEELKRYVEILEENYHDSIRDINMLVQKAKRMAPLADDLLHKYFQCLQYEIGPREEEAIVLFGNYCTGLEV